MPVTERVMGLGDWSLRLRPDTPQSLLDSISTPFSEVLIASGRLPASTTSDATFLSAALYTGVCLRPGPQLELSGCSSNWYLGDESGGAGYFASGKNISAGTLSAALATTLSGTPFSVGSVGSASVLAWDTGPTNARGILAGLAGQTNMEWRVNPDRTVDVNSVAALYGATPTAIVVRRQGPQQVEAPWGLHGTVQSTWDWEAYGSQVHIWTLAAKGTAGGASPYRGPDGNYLTIARGYEMPELPSGSEGSLASWWLAQINRAVRTVEVTADTFAVTGYAKCGASVWLYDPVSGLVDTANPVQYAGEVIWPTAARIVSVTWPIERGMSVLIRQHDGTAVTYVDLTDWVEWESPGARMEVSTAAQHLVPPTPTPLESMWRPWQAYAPGWAATISNPSLGNGTLTGRYRRLGTSLELSIRLVIGSTTTLGAGAWAFGLPGGMTPAAGAGRQYGTAAFGQSMHGRSWADPAWGGNLWCVDDQSPWNEVSATVPIAWAAGDILEASMTLEVAP